MADRPDTTDSQRRSLRAAATRVTEILQTAGFTAYFAGGCVRDELMGLEPDDYDVATDARPDQVQSLFRKTRAVGESFGVVLVRLHGHAIEVATFRAEAGYSDRRRPDVVRFTSAEEDAKRRDFTINGLFKDPVHNRVIDFVGGQADLKASLIRAIGNPSERLAEDHLRSLRAVRFAARFGFDLQSETAQAIRDDGVELLGVSRERIGQEVRMMLKRPGRGRAASLMQDLGLDTHCLAEGHSTAEPRTLDALPPEIDYPAALAAWAIDRGCDRRRVVSRWRSALMLSNDERDELGAILRDLQRIRRDWSRMGVAERKKLAATPHFDRVTTILRILDPEQAHTVLARVDALGRMHGGLAPAPVVTGDDLIGMGMTPGPAFKSILNRVYDAQLEGRVRSREEGMALARRIAGSA